MQFAMAEPRKSPEEAEAFRQLFAAIIQKNGWSRARLTDELNEDARARGLPKCAYSERTIVYWETPPGHGRRSSQPRIDRRKHLHDWFTRKIEEHGLHACSRYLRFICPAPELAPPSARSGEALQAVDYFPTDLRATRYVGGPQALEDMTEKFRRYRLHIVIGPGGVGKTARVAQAIEPLWKEGLFPGGRFWINVYNRGTSRAEDVAGRAVLREVGETPSEDVGQQARHILAAKSNLVLIEGGETVPEDEVAALIAIFPRASKLIWMTRRKSDRRHDSLQEDAVEHDVNPLLPEEALELLCTTAGKDYQQIPKGDIDVWKAIALETKCFPLLLCWAGKALHRDWMTEPADYLEELHRDPLRNIADPVAREEKNAGRFLRRSLARVTPTREIPNLPQIAERLFYSTAAFDSAYGSPPRWLAISIGLCDNRDHHFRSAERSLISLELIAIDEGKLPDQPIRPFHAHAQAVACEMWREQSPTARLDALKKLWKTAVMSFEPGLPIESLANRPKIQGRAAEAAHFAHWMQELRQLDVSNELANSDSSFREALQSLSEHWERFLLGDATRQPLPRLKETAWTAVCRSREEILATQPDSPFAKARLAGALAHLGEVRRARRDLTSAEQAYRQALALYKELTSLEDSLKRPEYRFGLAKALASVGTVHRVREEWANAEAAFRESMVLSGGLAAEYPHQTDYDHLLAACWSDLVGVKRARCDLMGAEEASRSALALCEGLVKKAPDSVEFERELLRCWFNLVRVLKARDEYLEAEKASRMAIKISERLFFLAPTPDHKHRQVVALTLLGHALLGRQDWAGAEEAYTAAMKIAETLAAEHPDMPDFENTLFIAWANFGVVRKERKDIAGSTAAFEQALVICQRLADLYPDLPRHRNNLGVTWYNLALAYEKQSLRSKAIENHQRALELRIALAEKFPTLPEYQENVAISWELESDFRAKLKEWPRAGDALEKAISKYQQLASEHPQLNRFQIALKKAKRNLKNLAVQISGPRRKLRKSRR